MEFHPIANIFPMLGDTELHQLADDIEAKGLQEPIWTYEGKILDGRNRYCACTIAGVAPRFRPYEGNDPVGFVVSLNIQRRHLTSSQLAVVALEIEPLEAEEAKKRMTAGINQYASPSQIFEQGSTGKASEKAAERVGTNRQYVSSAKKLAKEAPALLEQVRTGELTIPQAIRKATTEAFTAQYEPVPLPAGRYSTIVIDPPWPMEKIAREVRPNQVTMDYPTLSQDELFALPVPDLAADDAHLYLWTTHKFLPLALRMVEHWGFRYQCLMTWVKNVGFTPYSWMYSTEHVLFCRHGSLDLQQLGRRLDFHAPVREHSRKPNEFYRLVHEVSPGPRLDMYAREEHEGFESWGNEVGKFPAQMEVTLDT